MNKPKYKLVKTAVRDDLSQCDKMVAAIALQRIHQAAPKMFAALKELQDAEWLNMPGRANQIVEDAINYALGTSDERGRSYSEQND